MTADEVAQLLVDLRDLLTMLRSDAALEEAFAAADQQGAWFAMKASLQSAEGLLDAIGGGIS